MKISLLINMKMPTTVSIFIFISREKFHAQLSWAWKKFYNLGAWSESPFSECKTKKKKKKKKKKQLHPWLSGEDSDQTARMRNLIWIFSGRTCPKARFSDFVAHISTNLEGADQTARRLIWAFLWNLLLCFPNKRQVSSLFPFRYSLLNNK